MIFRQWLPTTSEATSAIKMLAFYFLASSVSAATTAQGPVATTGYVRKANDEAKASRDLSTLAMRDYIDPRGEVSKEHDLSYWCSQPIEKGVPTFKQRTDLGHILEKEGLTRGAELGVQKGSFANKILSKWEQCNYYLLVDVWAPLENYEDIANVKKDDQDANMKTALDVTEKIFGDKVQFCRNFTSECVKTIPDESLDFIYVDARHDFLGVYTDLKEWWPKLKRGGIFAGHDYVTQDDGPSRSGQDWTMNFDGTKDETGTVVKGAVDLFASQVCRQVTVSYRENAWNTWAMRK